MKMSHTTDQLQTIQGSDGPQSDWLIPDGENEGEKEKHEKTNVKEKQPEKTAAKERGRDRKSSKKPRIEEYVNLCILYSY